MVIEEVKEQLGIDLVRKPLAAPIYAEAKDFYARHGLNWRKNRRLMEGIGEALNEDYPDGDKIVEIYEANFDESENIIVEDCRRLTQTSFFEKHEGIFIRVNASDEVRKSRCAPGEWAEGHVTDTELDDYPTKFVVDNNGENLEVLRGKVRQIVGELKLGL